MIDEIEFVAQVKIVPVLARSGTLAAAIDRVYQKLGYDVWSAAERGNDASRPIEFEPDDANKLLASLEQQHHNIEAGGDEERHRAERQLAGAR